MKKSMIKGVWAMTLAAVLLVLLCLPGGYTVASAASEQNQFALDMTASVNAGDSSLIDVVITVKDIQQELDAVEFDLYFDNSLVEGVVTQSGTAEDGSSPMDAFMTVKPMYTLSVSGVEVQVPRYEQICRYDAEAGLYECRFLDMLQYVSPKPGETYRGLINDGDLVITIPFKILDGADLSSEILFSAKDVKGTTRVGLNSVPGAQADVSYTSSTETDPVITLKYPSLSFEDEVRCNIYFTVDDISSITEMGLITFDSKRSDGTVDNALEVVPGYTESAGYYVVQSAGIPAKKLGDTLYFKVYAKLSDGGYVYSPVAGYSPVSYAKSVLNNSNSSAKAKSLMVAMLNYGAAAQVNFSYNTASLANNCLTADQMTLVADYNASMVASVVKVDSGKVGIFKNSGGFAKRYPTVSFEGAFLINYYFEPSQTPDGKLVMYYWTQADYNAATTLTAGNATGRLILTKEDTGEYRGAVEGIAPKDLDGTVYVATGYTSGGASYCTGVLAYSIGAYCVSQAGSSTAAQSLASATALYAYYAKQYFYSV